MITQSKAAKALLDRLNGLSTTLAPIGSTVVPVEHPMLKNKRGDDVLSAFGGIPPG